MVMCDLLLSPFYPLRAPTKYFLFSPLPFSPAFYGKNSDIPRSCIYHISGALPVFPSLIGLSSPPFLIANPPSFLYHRALPKPLPRLLIWFSSFQNLLSLSLLTQECVAPLLSRMPASVRDNAAYAPPFPSSLPPVLFFIDRVSFLLLIGRPFPRHLI